MDQLQRTWQTFGRLELATESPTKRKALGKLREKLSWLLHEREGNRVADV